MKDYTQGATPESAYEDWRKDWQPPLPRPLALPGKVIVEFGPYGNTGNMWRPEGCGYNAMVVSDGYEQRASRQGFLPAGTEVSYVGEHGTNFEYQGRQLTVLEKNAIELLVTG